METSKKSVFKDQVLMVGLFLIVISTGIFLSPEIGFIHLNSDSNFGIFFFNYCISAAYMLLLLVNGFMKFKWAIFKNNIDYSILLLILYLISAFSLNREIAVFEQSTEWVCVYLTTQCLTLILLTLRRHIPFSIQYVLFFLLGAGILIYAYFAVYLFPLYLFGLLGAIFLGFSLHVFIPILLFIFSILIFRKAYKENRMYLYPFLAGITIPFIIAIYFIFQWNSVKNKVNYILNESIITESTLPIWVKLSQRIPKNMFMEKMLKTDLVYSTPDKDGFWGWRMPQRSFDEVKKHDPLVMTATLFAGKPDIKEDEKIKILESMYDSRHQAQERLWAGDQLETTNIISNIKIFPEYHIAYTEKILSIHNNTESKWWNNEQEAIYTFHLPEGGVVTSLSLWIGGKEEKGIMTTKTKADSAYKTIVGVEQRDPSVVHWQEGNTVSVRVFPCTRQENRRFKIGVTAPLRKNGNQLVYENIYFDGPTGKNATESVQVQFTQKPENIDLPFTLLESGNNTFKSDKQYEPYWELKFNSPNLSNKGFSFDGCNYTIENYKKKYENFKPQVFYLDLNSSWSKEELLKLWANIKNQEVYVYQEELIKVNTENIDGLYDQLSQLNFSLFPIQKVKNPEKAIIITKGTSVSANLKDLAGSDFSNDLTHYLKDHKQIRLFNLGNNLTPYLKTLKELRVFLYSKGSIEELTELLKQGKYIQQQENDSTIVIDNAEIVIKESNLATNQNGPDHLLRLFAYNHIMKKVSDNYFNDNFINDSTIAEAQKAYVVSPVSSLIVLETQKDYERFNIEDSKNSLKNASMKSSGAVPEPGEWLLIILTALVILYFFSKSNIDKKSII